MRKKIPIFLTVFLGTANMLRAFNDPIIAHQQYPDIPAPTAAHLHQGSIEKSPRDPARAPIVLTIDEPDPWVLYVRAHSSYLTPVGLRKPTSDIMWKHNQEYDHSWRKLTTSENLVYDGSRESGPVTIYLDLKAAVGWHDLPADYSSPIEFVLRRA